MAYYIFILLDSKQQFNLGDPVEENPEESIQIKYASIRLNPLTPEQLEPYLKIDYSEENDAKNEAFDPNVISKNLKCQRCDQIFENKDLLIDHQTIIFETIMKNSNTSLKFCSVCSFKSCNILGLICHQKNEHSEIDFNNKNSIKLITFDDDDSDDSEETVFHGFVKLNKKKFRAIESVNPHLQNIIQQTSK